MTSQATITGVAQAIYNEQVEINGWLETPWDKLSELQQQMWIRTALAAIHAIEERGQA